MVSAASSRTVPASLAHPLDPLTANEIRQTVAAVRAYVKTGAPAPKPIEKILFNSISLQEPNKYAVLLWLGTFTEKQIRAAATGEVESLKRQAEVSLPASILPIV